MTYRRVCATGVTPGMTTRARIMAWQDTRLPQRFWAKCELNYNRFYVGRGSPCWEWIGARAKKGYGVFWYKGKKRRVHRLTKRFRKTAHHRCWNTSCCNPGHTIDISRKRNSALGHAKCQIGFSR